MIIEVAILSILTHFCFSLLKKYKKYIFVNFILISVIDDLLMKLVFINEKEGHIPSR
jgi:hypothetical protein